MSRSASRSRLKLPMRAPERLDVTGTSLAERRKTFDDVAELYERFRPGYPGQLADDVVWLSGIPPRGRILEIGCGSGKASILFAERGYRVLCLEPGLNFVRLAKEKLAAFPDARVEPCTFEEWRLEESALDLVIAAQSFHFIEPVSGLSKVARALRAGGAFAAFANHLSAATRRFTVACRKRMRDMRRRWRDSIWQQVLKTGSTRRACSRRWS